MNTYMLAYTYKVLYTRTALHKANIAPSTFKITNDSAIPTELQSINNSLDYVPPLQNCGHGFLSGHITHNQ